MEPLEDFVKEKPLLAVGATVLIIAVLGLLGWLIFRQIDPQEAQPEVLVIELSDGQNTVTIERNGLVTIKTPHGTYTQKWDKEKIRKFFAEVDNLSFATLTSYVGSDLAIVLTLSNGETVTIQITEELSDTTETIQETLEEVYEEEIGEEVEILFPVPTILPVVSPSAGPVSTSTPLPGGGDGGSDGDGGGNPWGGGEVEPEVFGCEQIEAESGQKVVISNTVCTDIE